jgi:hypothetical protein
MDSIKFYKNGGFYQSARPKDDTINDDSYLLTMLSTGKCSFGSTGKTSRSDTATDCIKINGNSAVGHGYGGWPFALVDGHRIVGSKRGGIRITIDGPFIIGREGIQDYLFWDKRQIWQPRQQFKKTKQK